MKLFLITFLSIFFSCSENIISIETLNTIVAKEKNYKEDIKYIKDFAKTNNYNQKLAFLIDYSLHSGKKRFFIVDLKNEVIIKKGLVCHGSCKEKKANGNDYAKNFSNTSESLCSTLGMSVISDRAYSKWGRHYKYWIDGLEKTNNNMRKRVVVLHSWEGVPDKEIYPETLATSWGCPTVSLDFLDQLDEILKTETKILLYSIK